MTDTLECSPYVAQTTRELDAACKELGRLNPLADAALAQAERLRGRALDLLEDTESVRKTQPRSNLLDDFSNDLDKALAALVRKIEEY